MESMKPTQEESQLKGLTHKTLKNMFLQKDIKKLSGLFGGLLGVLLIALLFVGVSDLVGGGKKACAILVNDRPVVNVASADLADDVISGFLDKQAKAVGTEVYLSERIDVCEVATREEILKDKDQITAILADSVTPIVSGAAIVVNGKGAVRVASTDIATDVLQSLKDQSVANYPQLDVVDVKFRENVKVFSKLTPVSQVLSQADAKKYLTDTKVVEGKTYTMTRGETLWDASMKLGVSLYELQANNPQLNPKHLQGGEVLVLEKEVPILQVVAVFEKTQESVIPYKVAYKTDRSMAAGTSRVSQEGKEGKENVSLQIVITNGQEERRTRVASTLITAPVDKIVTTSPAATMASRSSSVKSTGVLKWPTSASRISSYYGGRSRGFHTGIDIDGSSGDSVWAADGGKVVFAGYSGGYGYMVKIDHGNGMQTWYAHMSKILVKNGSYVEKGDRVGLEGSTGNSTGSHLHFEVRINGASKNPLSYLKR